MHLKQQPPGKKNCQAFVKEFSLSLSIFSPFHFPPSFLLLLLFSLSQARIVIFMLFFVSLYSGALGKGGGGRGGWGGWEKGTGYYAAHRPREPMQIASRQLKIGYPRISVSFRSLLVPLGWQKEEETEGTDLLPHSPTEKETNARAERSTSQLHNTNPTHVAFSQHHMHTQPL